LDLKDDLMNKAKHRLLTPNELAEQRRALQQAQVEKLMAAQKKKAEDLLAKASDLSPNPAVADKI